MLWLKSSSRFAELQPCYKNRNASAQYGRISVFAKLPHNNWYAICYRIFLEPESEEHSYSPFVSLHLQMILISCYREIIKAKKIRNGERKDQKNWFFVELQKKIKIRIRNRGFGNTQNIKTNKKNLNQQTNKLIFWHFCYLYFRNRHFRNSGFENIHQKETLKIYQYEVLWKTKKDSLHKTKNADAFLYINLPHNRRMTSAQQLMDVRTTADMQAHNSCCAAHDSIFSNDRYYICQQLVLYLPTTYSGSFNTHVHGYWWPKAWARITESMGVFDRKHGCF